MVLDDMTKHDKLVRISIGQLTLEGDLHLGNKQAIVLFVHGSGSTRNKYVADILQKAGLGTLLFDLLTRDEEESTSRLLTCVLILGFLQIGWQLRLTG